MSLSDSVRNAINRSGCAVVVKHYSEDTDILLEYATKAVVMGKTRERRDNTVFSIINMIIPVFDHTVQVGDLITIGGLDVDVDKVEELTQQDGSTVYYKVAAVCPH